MQVRERNSKYSAIAQWWSIRLLTEGLQVRVLLAEQNKAPIFSGLLIFMEYHLYILKSSKIEKYYIGISQNPQKILEYHNTLEKGFKSRFRPWSIVYTQSFNSKEDSFSCFSTYKRCWQPTIIIH